MTKLKKYSVAERLSFPKYGDIGYEDSNPVGRKHVSSKLSAIHKIIFNEEARLPPRKVYNQIKHNLSQYKSQDFKSQSSQNSPRYYRNQSMQNYPQQYDKNHKYDLMQRQSIQDTQKNDQPFVHISDFLQQPSQILLTKSSNKKHYSPPQDRLDSLDKIIDPYKNYQAMIRRRKSLQENSSTNQNYQWNSDQLMKDNLQSYQDNSFKRGLISPTFLNSML